MTKPTDSNLSFWWETFYDDAAMAVLADQDPKQIRSQAEMIMRATGLVAGQTAMDQCCGLGQHACVLAARGVRVVGIDQSPMYIEQARRQAAGDNKNPEFLVADALVYRHHETVDAVYNWHSSFGYFDDDAMNCQMLSAAHASLRDGGMMLLEFPNMPHLLNHFRGTMRTEHPGGVLLERESTVSPDGTTLHQTWTYRWNGRDNGNGSGNGSENGKRSHRSSLRIYHPDQLIAMFKESGFVDVRVSSHDGDELTAECARLLVTGRKRGDE